MYVTIQAFIQVLSKIFMQFILQTFVVETLCFWITSHATLTLFYNQLESYNQIESISQS